MVPRLEISVGCADSLHAALTGGADRIELCSAFELGGLTPGPGLMALARNAPVPIHVLIRPRAGDFCFSASEIDAMLADIAAVRAAGLAGVVLGAATPDGSLDEPVLTRLIAAAKGLEIGLHRVFDCTPDADAALETAIRLGFRHVLSSGGATTALAGADQLRHLHARASGRITIMAAAGLSAATAPLLLDKVPLAALHASCSVAGAAPDPRHLALGFATGPRRITDAAAVRALKRAINARSA